MNDLLKHFKADFSRAVLDVLWGAWSQVGVMAHARPAQARIVDPEALLLLTWECARQDSRAFDEVLDWLVHNGRWINVMRLTTLLEEDKTCSATIAGAIAKFMMRVDKGPKWCNLSKRNVPESEPALEPLFQKQGKPMAPLDDDRDLIFAGYGWARSPVSLRGYAQSVPGWMPASLVLKCRALFGVNTRADVFAWLVANGQGSPSQIARELGYSQRRVQDTLTEMQYADLFRTRFDGNKKEYALDASKGWQLLFESTTERAKWFNWRAFGRAVAVIWKATFGMKEEDLTDYLFTSEIGKALVEAQPDFNAAGVNISERSSPFELMEKIKWIE